MSDIDDNPLVSLIITTKNEEKNIENCLISIKNQSYKNIEIIVVDNNSTDKTKEISYKYTDKVFDKGPERSAQRNYGMINIAKGEYVMYIDADMILTQNLVSDCINYMKSNGFDSLYIPEIILGKSFWSQVRRFERSFYDGTVIDCCRIFRKDFFEKLGGFDESMSGPEDWDIDKKSRLSGKIGLLKNDLLNAKAGSWSQYQFVKDRGVDSSLYGQVVYHNESEFDVCKYLSKKGYYAKSFDTYINKRGKNDIDVKKQLGVYYRFLGVFIENGKWIKLFKHPILTFGMYFLRIMVGFKFLFRK